MPPNPYVYAFVRKDLPIEDQIVQVAHACHEAGSEFGAPEDCHLVLCGVSSQVKLGNAEEKIRKAGVRTSCFIESDDEMGLTAFCTEPVELQHREHFKGFQTWKPSLK